MGSDADSDVLIEGSIFFVASNVWTLAVASLAADKGFLQLGALSSEQPWARTAKMTLSESSENKEVIWYDR